MPCKDGPISDDYKNKLKGMTFNSDAARLHRWLDEKLGYPALDETGRLCNKIRSLGNQDFWNVVGRNLLEPEARELLRWWEAHQDYDVREGR